MDQQVEITVKLTLWVDASLSSKQLTLLALSRLAAAFAKETESIPDPVRIISVREEAEIYSSDLPVRFDDYEIYGICEFDEDGRNFSEQVPDDEVCARITGRPYGPRHEPASSGEGAPQ
jgi:hypothetical protein